MSDTIDTTEQIIEDDPIAVRRAKREALMAAGKDPYGHAFAYSHHLADLAEQYADLEDGASTEDEVKVAGRVMAKRDQGKLAFLELRDSTGDMQLFCRINALGEDAFAELKDLDVGDWIGVEGTMMRTKRGQLSVSVASFELLSKSLRPLPEKFHGLADKETRYRQRYVDLVMNREVRDTFEKRFKVVSAIRRYMEDHGYYEVETPILHPILGGANARPFVTHHNALDKDFYLRIATELHLKRLLVGGFEKVFEIGRQFRNEGMDSSHSPEFTSLEAYEAYSDYNGMAELTRDLIQQAARDAFDLSEGEEIVRLADGTEYDLSGQWDRIDLYGSTSEALGEEVTVETPRETLVKYAERIGLEVDDYAVSGKIVEDIFEELVASKLWAPTFVYDFPEDTSPLTRYHRSRPGLTEKWDLYVRGFETGTAYSELADPVVQRERFEAQALAAANGDPEAMVMDEDFLIAMEQGFPPCGGMGMGIDRLLMVLTGQGIRETIPFPLVKRLG